MIIFRTDYKDLNHLPWSDDKYMKTSLDDDAALQFGKKKSLNKAMYIKFI